MKLNKLSKKSKNKDDIKLNKLSKKSKNRKKEK